MPRRRGSGPPSRSDSWNATSRVCTRGALRSNSSEARIGDFASSAAARLLAASVPSTAAAMRVLSLMLLFIHDEGMERVALQLLAPFQERQLDHERDAHYLAAELLDQPERCRHRAPGSKQIVHGQHVLPRLDGVLVDGQGVAAVLELVFDL